MKTQFDLTYGILLDRIMEAAVEKDERTGMRFRSVPGALIYVPTGTPLLTLRDINVKWTCAETFWFLGGCADPDWMEFFGFKAWRKFEGADGDDSYLLGKRWIANGFNQIVRVASMLDEDPTARRAVLCGWNARTDMAVADRKKNAPCVPLVHFTVVNGELHLTALQRSADVFFGLPHDIASMSMIRDVLASYLGYESGSISWVIGNAHAYENQFGACELMRDRAIDTPGCTTNFAFEPKPDWLERSYGGDKSLVLESLRQLDRQYAKRHMGPIPEALRPELVV